MSLALIKQKMAEILKDRSAPRDRRKLIYEFGDLIGAIEQIIEREETPARVRAKAESFLDLLSGKVEEHGPKFWQDGYIINSVGEVMVSLRYVAQPVLDFLRTGLYFYGINWIERTHRREAMGLMSAHADLLVEYVSRESVKQLVKDGRQTMAVKDGRFCVVYHYVNTLRKRYWAEKRRSTDACDVSVALIEGEEAAAAAPVETPEPAPTQGAADGPMDTNDRVRLMLHIFDRHLSGDQQRIYLMRQRENASAEAVGSAEGGPGLRDLFASFEETGRARTWSEIAAELGMTEKSAKREYLRGLLGLLRESAAAVFGEDRPPRFVRRMLTTLQTIVQERDLRIRDNAGRGLGQIVARWEIALRYVLNHGLLQAADGIDVSWSRKRS